jgi:hypothetical protein
MSQGKYINFYEFLKSQNNDYEIPLALEEEVKIDADKESTPQE